MNLNPYHIISVSMGFSQQKALDELMREVNRAMDLGWRPVGGVAISGTRLLQAVVKER